MAQVLDRVAVLCREDEEVGAQRRPGGCVGQPGHEVVGRPVEPDDGVVPQQVLGGDGQGVRIPGDCLAEQGCRVLGEASFGVRGGGRLVVGDDAFEEVGRGERVDVLGPDDVVRVAVVDDLQVQVVGGLAAGERGVGDLAGLLAGEQGVAGIGRHALDGVDGRGVSERDEGAHVVGGQAHRPSVGRVLHGQFAAGVHGGDLPAVAVLDPVGRGQAQSAVVRAGDDGVADRRLVAVSEGDGVGGAGLAEAVGAGATVELADELAGGGKHDRVVPGVAVVAPGVEDLVGQGGLVPDVDAPAVQVEAERLGHSLAQRQGGGAFGGVGEPHELGQVQGAVGGADVAQDTAGADCGELLVVADQPDGPAPVGDEADQPVQGDGVGHPCFVDHDESCGADPAGPLGGALRVVVQVPENLGHGVRGCVDRLAEYRGRSGRGGQADDLPTAGGPGGGERAHRRRLACTGGCDRELDPRTGGHHLEDQGCLARIQRESGSGRRGKRDVDRVGGGACAVVPAGGGHDPCLGLEERGRSEPVGTGDVVDRPPVGPDQRVRGGDAVAGRCQRDRAAGQDFVDQQSDHPVHVAGWQVGVTHPAQRFGLYVPALPGRAVGLHRGHDRSRGVADPRGVDPLARYRDGAQGAPEHLPHAALAAEHLPGLGGPGRTLLSQAARTVLRPPGLDGRLLGELDGLDRGRWPPVGRLERRGQLGPARLDVRSAGGPAGCQGSVDADDLAHRASPVASLVSGGEPEPEGVGQVALEHRVVGLRRGDRCGEQQAPVDGQPAPAVAGLHLVGDRNVGVQVWVAGPGVAVGERGRDQSPNLDLADPARALPGEQGGALEVGERVLHGCQMCPLNLGRHLGLGDRPQCADGLDRGEGQVEPGDGVGPRARVLGDRRGHLARVDRVAAVLGAEQLDSDPGTDPGPFVQGDGIG